jgi:hypothetical protein
MSTIEQLLGERFNTDVIELAVDERGANNNSVWTKVVSIVLKSKTAWAFFGSLTPKKRKKWLYNFCHDLDKIANSQVKQAYY